MSGKSKNKCVKENKRAAEAYLKWMESKGLGFWKVHLEQNAKKAEQEIQFTKKEPIQ